MSVEDYEYMESFYNYTNCSFSIVSREERESSSQEIEASLCSMEQFKVEFVSHFCTAPQCQLAGRISSTPWLSCHGGLLCRHCL